MSFLICYLVSRVAFFFRVFSRGGWSGAKRVVELE